MDFAFISTFIVDKDKYMKHFMKCATIFFASSIALSAHAGLFDEINSVLDTVDKVNNTIDRGESAAKRTAERFPEQKQQAGQQAAQTARPYGTQQFPGNIFTPQTTAMEYNIDRKGLDYRSFELNQPDAKLCQSTCNGDNRCKAWTYVKPGIQSNKAMCWLKDRVPQAHSNSCCTSGVKGAQSTQYKTSGYDSINVSGNWKSDWGDMTFKQKQAASDVSGTYGFNAGRIYGTMRGNTLTGYWTQSSSSRKCTTRMYGSYHWGRISFTFTDNQFKGMYQNCEQAPTPDYEWNGTRK